MAVFLKYVWPFFDILHERVKTVRKSGLPILGLNLRTKRIDRL